MTISDLRPAEELSAACASLEAFAASLSRTPHDVRGGTPHDEAPRDVCGGIPLGRATEPALRFALGGHPLSLLDSTDLLCLSGGVSPAIPIVRSAVARGIPLSNDGLLTLRYCPVPIIGITGSAGKTTTTTLVGRILEASGFTVHVGGNIGTPLLDRLESIHAGDKVVMELSSFQLELYDASPAIAVVLNITPNHLDRHPSMSHYAAAKANILRYQGWGDTCVLCADDGYTGPWLQEGRCQIAAGEGQEAVAFPLRADRLGFSLTQQLPAGAFLEGDALVWRRPGLPDVKIGPTHAVQLRGRHNLANILAACCAAGAAGAAPQAMMQVAKDFRGVEHRLELVRERNGVLWVNDSIATAPERTVAALRAFSEPIVLLAGGRDKRLPWAECAAVIQERSRHVVLFGEAAGLIGDALAHCARDTGVMPVQTTRCRDLAEAVAVAAAVSRTGDVVLLAPGGTSFDAYTDFEARGRHFRTLVEALP